jgi:CRISPR-associated protein Cst2
MKLTGVFVIETGVVNRGDGIGNIATVKKVNTPEGIKVFFSPVSYKRALWKSLQQNKNWKTPMVTKEGGVVQRTGTIIDSEEFDFGGTMIAKPKYEREATLLVDNGISINNYYGDMEFMTNMAISKLFGENEANIINKENFYGLYILPFGIELDRVGIQEITFDTKIGKNESITEKMRKIYKGLNLEKNITDEKLQEWSSIVEDIQYDDENKTTKIILKKEERKRRLKDLLEGMGDLAKRIEGSERNLSPYFASFSLDFASPKYMLLIKDFLKEKIYDGGYLDTEELTQKLMEFAKTENKEIKTADYLSYNSVINEIIERIFNGKDNA